VITDKGLDITGETFAGQNEWINIAEGEKHSGLFIFRNTRGSLLHDPAAGFFR
jgi:hypothetical protein